MNRVGRFLAAFAMALSFTFTVGTLVSAGGCSGSSGTFGQAERNEEGQKLLQDRMKENMAKRNGPMKTQKKK